MGFRREPLVRTITFDDQSDFPGLVIRIGGLSIDEWLDLKYPEALDLFADRLVEWNWETDDGALLGTDRESVGTLDASDIRTLIASWSDTVARKRSTNPLVGAAQPNGSSPPPDPNIEASMPMGPPSNDGTT